MRPIPLFEEFLRFRADSALMELSKWCRAQDEDCGELFIHPGKKALYLCHGDAYSQYVDEAKSKAEGLGYAFECDAECYPWDENDDTKGGWIPIVDESTNPSGDMVGESMMGAFAAIAHIQGKEDRQIEEAMEIAEALLKRPADKNLAMAFKSQMDEMTGWPPDPDLRTYGIHGQQAFNKHEMKILGRAIEAAKSALGEA
jgi:hypothetical protein